MPRIFGRVVTCHCADLVGCGSNSHSRCLRLAFVPEDLETRHRHHKQTLWSWETRDLSISFIEPIGRSGPSVSIEENISVSEEHVREAKKASEDRWA